MKMLLLIYWVPKIHGTLVGLIFTIAWLKFTLKPLSIDIMAMIKLFYKKN